MFGKRGICANKDIFSLVCSRPQGHGGEHQCDQDGLRWTWEGPGFACGSKPKSLITVNRVIFAVLTLGLALDFGFVGMILYHDKTRIRYEDMPPVPVNTVPESPNQ